MFEIENSNYVQVDVIEDEIDVGTYSHFMSSGILNLSSSIL